MDLRPFPMHDKLPTLFQKHQEKADSLLERQLVSQEKSKEAIAISLRILELNNQIIAEKYKLAGVEKDVAASNTIIEYICENIKRVVKV